ncbi:MAG: phosphoenolpyruvate carboxykinase (ATP) [Rhizobacter sp.]|nr:phosphoenolpyruvate carboxykinase (ATP) [Chlorobiales bacterium]
MTNILQPLGITPAKSLFHNLNSIELLEHSVRRSEGTLSDKGALVVKTGKKTGRSANDKFIVEEPTSKDKIWWGNNKPFSPAQFEKLQTKMMAFAGNLDLYVQDLLVGADTNYNLKIRVVNEYAWHNLFARDLFIRPTEAQLKGFAPEFTIINLPSFKATPSEDGTLSETFVVLNFEKKIVLIGGTGYAGETKKSVFTIMNYLMPLRGVLSMHCSANVGSDGKSAVFFGLSGTGKTSLSADPLRGLIGDDEHCWSDASVFNIEGGCYAKCINLTHEQEPLIYDAVKFGSVVENAVMNETTRAIDFADASLTENTRCAYPLEYITNALLPSVGPKPANIVFLTCDAYGVLPPISKLTAEQAMYHYLLGYTAKVAGTEIGITEPTMTFSPCFGGPFLALHPTDYAKLLGEKIKKENVQCWLVNTGWSGGEYGVGKRMKISYTRAMVNAALSGKLDGVKFVEDPIFKVAVPTSCPEVPAEVLMPRHTWADKEAYDKKAVWLAKEFIKNFEKYSEFASDEVKAASPNVETVVA